MRKSLPQAILTVVILTSIAYSSEIYITQNTSGAGTGADCANAHSASWVSANATGGNTYHLCGTFTGAAGATMLTVPSGSAGNTLTVYFETGAVLTSPYWGANGAIYIPSGSAYVKIDGGTNGVIQDTANGDSLSNQQASNGIYIANGAHDVEVANLTIKNQYVSTPGGTGSGNATNASNIYAGAGSLSNISIHNNTLTSAGQGVRIWWNGGTANNINVYSNTISDHRFQIEIASYGLSGSSSNINVYGNDLSGWSNWNTSNDYYHLDGIIVYGSAGHPTNVNIFDNYIHGDFVANGTAFIYCTWDGINTGGTSSVCDIFNNVIAISNSNGQGKAIWTGSYTGPHTIVNNTIVGNSSNGVNNLISVDGTVGVFKNNLYTASGSAVSSYASSCCVDITASDYNLYYGLGSEPFAYNIGASGTFLTYPQWQSHGFDAHGITGNPNLSSTYSLQTGSAAIGMGTNLTSLCGGNLAQLCTDRAGVVRPSTGSWDIGAYQYSSQSVTVAPPTSLSAIVN
jgi:hypothetical protein